MTDFISPFCLFLKPMPSFILIYFLFPVARLSLKTLCVHLFYTIGVDVRYNLC